MKWNLPLRLLYRLVGPSRLLGGSPYIVELACTFWGRVAGPA